MGADHRPRFTMKGKNKFAQAKTLIVSGFVLTACLCGSRAAAAEKAEPGLIATFHSPGDKAKDVTTTPNVWLFVEAGQPPTPFLPAGKFTTIWEGIISADLRSDYFFQAELSGNFKLEINGALALEATSAGGALPLSKAVQLNKGDNALKATFTSPEKGDAFVRLAWTEKGTLTSPIPLTVLTHASTPDLQKGTQLRLGRELFLEHRCAKCHEGKLTEASVPELKMDTPTFEGIGARRNYDWMARWILDPKSLRSTAHMPKLLHGPKAKEDAEAMAVYLTSLKQEAAGSSSKTKPKITVNGKTVEVTDPRYEVTDLDLKPSAADKEPAAETSDEHKSLFEKLHCAACHNAPDAKEVDAKKVSFTHVGEKFAPGKLAAFLQKPETHYAWIRMPNFKLTAKEAKELADFLLATNKPKDGAVAMDKAIIERGKNLVQTSGCLDCHSLKLENKFKNPPLEILFSRHLKERSKVPAGDCLGATPFANYQFSAEERTALAAFTAAGSASLTRHVPAEFAERQTRALNCNGCHGQIELVPPLELVGGKLKPEWATAFLAGEILYKPRTEKHPKGEPWLEARMPAFQSRATLLAQGLAAQHGLPPKTPAEPPIDLELAKIGQKLVGKDGGYSCISCHGVGPLEATEVFESEGINFARAGERLLPAFYRRWLRSPLSIDPQTKMPVYFEDGKSPLTELLDGDAEKQINAVWQYLRLGSKMPAPSTGVQ